MPLGQHPHDRINSSLSESCRSFLFSPSFPELSPHPTCPTRQLRSPNRILQKDGAPSLLQPSAVRMLDFRFSDSYWKGLGSFFCTFKAASSLRGVKRNAKRELAHLVVNWAAPLQDSLTAALA